VNIFPLAYAIENFIFENIFSDEKCFITLSKNNQTGVSNPNENLNSNIEKEPIKYNPLTDNTYKLQNKENIYFSAKIKNTLKNYLHLVVLDLAFIFFIIFNKFSIVLGDKTSHDLVLHLAQINHLMIFALFFFPFLNLVNFLFFLENINAIINRKFSIKHISIFFLISFTVYSIVMFFDKFSYVHDFIIADNRHYSFYYFKKIYMNANLRILILIYISLTYSVIIFKNMEIFKNTLFISWIICTCLAIIPAKLFEFRYFSPCYITFLLIMHAFFSKNNLKKFIFNIYNIIWSILVNSVTIYIFIFRPFIQKEFPETYSRFMW